MYLFIGGLIVNEHRVYRCLVLASASLSQQLKG